MSTDATTQHVVVRRTIVSFRLEIALASAVALIPLASFDAHAAKPRSADEPIVATCIARSAGGRAWLEKTPGVARSGRRTGWRRDHKQRRQPRSRAAAGQQLVGARLAARYRARRRAQIRHWPKQDACFNVEAAPRGYSSPVWRRQATIGKRSASITARPAGGSVDIPRASSATCAGDSAQISSQRLRALVRGRNNEETAPTATVRVGIEPPAPSGARKGVTAPSVVPAPVEQHTATPHLL